MFTNSLTLILLRNEACFFFIWIHAGLIIWLLITRVLQKGRFMSLKAALEMTIKLPCTLWDTLLWIPKSKLQEEIMWQCREQQWLMSWACEWEIFCGNTSFSHCLSTAIRETHGELLTFAQLTSRIMNNNIKWLLLFYTTVFGMVYDTALYSQNNCHRDFGIRVTSIWISTLSFTSHMWP